jgi:hypothetical protein
MSRQDLETVAESIEKSCSSGNAREAIFDHVLGQEDLIYVEDLDL